MKNKKLYLLLLLWWSSFFAIAQTDKLNWVGLSNGLTIIHSATNNATIQTKVYLRGGTIYETSNNYGTALLLSKIITNKCKKAIDSRGLSATVSAQVNAENLIFSFENSAATEDKILTIINQHIAYFTFNQNDISIACEALNKEKNDYLNKNTYTRKILNNVDSKLFGTDYVKLVNFEVPADYCEIDSAKIVDYHKRFFLPSNITFTVKGNISLPTVENIATQNFDTFYTQMYNPMQIYKVTDFKPVIYATQHFIEKNDGNSELKYIWQNPGSKKDRKGIYAAFLLNSLINSKNSVIENCRKKYATLSSIKSNFNPSFNYSTFEFIAQLDSSQFNTAALQLDSFVNDLVINNQINEAILFAAKKQFSMEFQQFKNNSDLYLETVAKYRYPNDNFFITALADSANLLTVGEMKAYLTKYFNDNEGTYLLAADPKKVESTNFHEKWFYLDDTIGNTTFYYEKNKYNLPTILDSVNAFKLVQWLRINPDVNILVNGFADNSEFEKVKEKDILQFVDSSPEYKKVVPDWLFKKRYFKPEMARSLKLIKYIADLGIAKDRIAGTSMKLHSDDTEKESANRKVTVYFYKIRPKAPSVLYPKK